MKTYNEMADSVFRRRNEYISERKKIIKMSVSFACMALVLFAGFGLWQKGKIENKPIEKNEVTNEQTMADSLKVGEKDYYEPVEDTPYNNGPCIPPYEEDNTGKITIISSYEEGSSSSACYALPKNGTCNFSIPLHAAFNAYGDKVADTGESVVYCLVVRVFRDGKMVTGKNDLSKIAEKLYGWGYTPSVEIYNDNPDSAVLTVLVTEEDLKKFPQDNDNGYMFFLYNEPDGIDLTAEGIPFCVDAFN